MEFAIFSTGRATTCMTDQFISSVKICTLHIRKVKCNVTLQIHRYSKHEAKATASRDTDRVIEREGQLSNKVHNRIYGSISSTALVAYVSFLSCQ